MMGEDSPETERARELIKEIAAKLYLKLPDIMVWSPSPRQKPAGSSVAQSNKKNAHNDMLCLRK
jgi:hypothetical protein